MAKIDKNLISIWSWLIIWLVMAIPIVNIIMFLVWAFTGENETRKNYFKAMIVLFIIGLIASLVLMMLGAIPFIIGLIASFFSEVNGTQAG